MDALHAVHLHQHLDVVGHCIAGVEAAIGGGLVVDPEELQELLLVNADFGADLSQALVGLVPRLVHHIDVVERLGVVKQSLLE